MTRAKLLHPVIVAVDRPGNTNIYAGLQVTVYEADGETEYTKTMYEATTGIAEKTNPLTTDSSGYIEAYADLPQTVVLKYTGSPTDGVKVGFAPADERIVETASDKRPWVNVRDFGAVGDGTTDDGPAIRLALAEVVSAGGGTLFLNTGTYAVRSLTGTYYGMLVNSDNVTIRGEGRSTIVTDGNAEGHNQGALFYAVGKSGLTIRDLDIEISTTSQPTVGPNVYPGNWAIKLDGANSGVVGDWLIENVQVRSATDCQGINLTNSFSTGTLGNVKVRSVTLTQAAGSVRTSDSLLIGSTQSLAVACHGLVIEDVEVTGYAYGPRHNGSGIWSNARINGVRLRNNSQQGLTLYHFDGPAVSNVNIDNCYGGMFIDCVSNGGTFSGIRIESCEVLGLYGEQWLDAAFTGLSCRNNGIGAWISSGNNATFTGCTFSNNDTYGLLIDRSAAPSGISQTVVELIENIVFSGCVISENGTDGVAVKGVRRGVLFTGCSITRNGQAVVDGVDDATAAASSGHADIRIRNDSSAAPGIANTYVWVTGCVIGNVTDSNSSHPNGGTQYGIYQPSGESILEGGIGITSTTITDVTTPISIGTNTRVDVDLCRLIGGNTLVLPSTTTKWGAGNKIIGGSLATTATAQKVWDHSGMSKLVLDHGNERTFGTVQSEVLLADTEQGRVVGDTPTTPGATVTGELTVIDPLSGHVAIFGLRGTNGAVLMSSTDNTKFGVVEGVDNKTNVFYDAGPYKIENQTGSTTTYQCKFFGNASNGGSFAVS